MNTNPCCNTWWKKPWGIFVLTIVGIAMAYAAVFHWSYFVRGLPFLFLLACPLMHLFMHHGHGDGAHTGKDSKSP